MFGLNTGPNVSIARDWIHVTSHLAWLFEWSSQNAQIKVKWGETQTRRNSGGNLACVSTSPVCQAPLGDSCGICGHIPEPDCKQFGKPTKGGVSKGLRFDWSILDDINLPISRDVQGPRRFAADPTNNFSHEISSS
jgi:hypothetical protein